MTTPFVHEPDPRVGDWVVSGLGPFGAHVGSLVPRGFEAYARVLHPASEEDDVPVPWAEVATACGTTLHPTAQWWALSGAPSWGGGRGRWTGVAPTPGSLRVAELAAVVDVLAAHTAGAGDAEVVAALWEGFGWVHGGGMVATLWGFSDDGPPPRTPLGHARRAVRRRREIRAARAASDRGPTPPGFGPDVIDGPRLQLPDRSYLLFRGPLGAVAGERGLPWPTAVDYRWWPQSPNLLWPADRSWCLATEIDLDSTVVGGSRALVDALLAHPGLEALPVREDDSLMADGDAING